MGISSKWWRLAVVSLQLALVVLVVHAFHIEESFGFLSITPLILAGFVVHALLPTRMRLPFFVALGMAAPLLVFGMKHGAVLIVLGLGLIALCHLPIPFRARVALVLAAGVGLALARAEVIATPGAISTMVLPILAAMFMFRLAIYLYDLKHEKTPASWWQRLAYFFLLPNICFPLFPVVDYQAFRRTYYDADEITIYEKGVLWMLRGVTHILLYRVIYYHLLPAPSEVIGLGGVVVYMLATYGLYLRISGQFHLIVGILCLFGFNLPETHHLYYLASSFNDYWRRINIYWKDFMMKLFYYPMLMRLRRWGMTTALVGATIFVFFGTWILHSYQWFWLRGSFPLTAPDALFWGILGALVVVNSLQEAKRGKRRKPKAAQMDWRAAFGRSARIVGMFAFISVLWSLWSTSSVSTWLRVVSQAGNSTPADWLLLAGTLAALTVIGAVLLRAHERGWQFTLLGPHPSFSRATAYVGVVALVAIGAAQWAARRELGEPGTAFIASLKYEGLNDADVAEMDRGYYEGLLEAPRNAAALGRTITRHPDDWESPEAAGAVRDREQSLLSFELVPSFDGIVKRAPFRTNQWGMRDRDYLLAKPQRTHRIAFIGASYEMGAGVDETELLSSIVEDRLNRQQSGGEYQNYEILNFAVGGYSILHNAVVLEEKVVRFEPDVVLYAIHSTELNRLATHLVKLLRERDRLGIDSLDHLLAASGVRAGSSYPEMRQLLMPHADGFLRWSFRQIAAQARQAGIVPAMVYVPVTTESVEAARLASDAILRIGRESGFVTLSLFDAFADQQPGRITLAPWDTHPNVLGHQLLADKLYSALLDHSTELVLQPRSTVGRQASHSEPESTVR